MSKKTTQDMSTILDEKFKDFREVLNKDMIHVFNQGYEELVMPDIERLDTKMDKVENRLGRVENRLEQMDRKLDVVTAKSFDNEAKLKNHDLRIQKVEKVLAVS